MPGTGPDGKMIFSNYVDNGFRIAVLDNPAPVNPEYAEYIPEYEKYIPEPNFNDRELPEYNVEKYRPSFGKMFILPPMNVACLAFPT